MIWLDIMKYTYGSPFNLIFICSMENDLRDSLNIISSAHPFGNLSRARSAKVAVYSDI